jgi:hypothetical protein
VQLTAGLVKLYEWDKGNRHLNIAAIVRAYNPSSQAIDARFNA